jgi:hypothetical protein
VVRARERGVAGRMVEAGLEPHAALFGRARLVESLAGSS